MGLMDELRKLTQPYGDEDDFYDGADSSFQAPAEPVNPNVNQANEQFENSFAKEQPRQSAPRRQPKAQPAPLRQSFSRPAKPGRKTASFGSEPQVVLFNPRSFDEAGELVNYLSQGRSLVMALESIPTETARRLLDFISGICYALGAKITPVSAKTYFVTPENVDVIDAQAAAQQGFYQDEDF